MERQNEERQNQNQSPPHTDEGPSTRPHIESQGVLILQEMTGIIQSALAQHTIDMNQLIEEKLNSKSHENKTQHTDGGHEEHTGDHTPRTKPDQVSFKTFKGCGATEFPGTIDPVVACSWIDSVEKVFEISHCAELDKVVYAAALLTERALNWWKAMTSSMGTERRRAMTWDEFKEKFMMQFCPPDLQRKYEQEFFDLKQGNKSVTEYEDEFHKKSKFASVFIPNEEVRIRRFVAGLRWEIKEMVQVRDVPTLEKAAEYARERESSLAARRSETVPPPRRIQSNFPSASSSFSRSAPAGRSFSQNQPQSRFRPVRI